MDVRSNNLRDALRVALVSYSSFKVNGSVWCLALEFSGTRIKVGRMKGACAPTV
jgi:hypothetical protein